MDAFFNLLTIEGLSRLNLVLFCLRFIFLVYLVYLIVPIKKWTKSVKDWGIYILVSCAFIFMHVFNMEVLLFLMEQPNENDGVGQIVTGFLFTAPTIIWLFFVFVWGTTFLLSLIAEALKIK